MFKSSEQHNEVWNKIFQIQTMGLEVVKNAKNPFYKSRYADLNQVNELLLPVLNELKLVISFLPCTSGLEFVISDVESSQWISGIYPMNIEDKNPQEIGSQVTYARRYTLKSIFNLSDIDDDGNAASGKSVVTEVAKPVPSLAAKPELKPRSTESGKLKADYDAGKLTKWSQVTNQFIVSEEMKLSIKAHMPNIDFNS